MTSSRRWMILTLALTLAAGASLGVVGDRLVGDDGSSRGGSDKRQHGVIWFPCEEASENRDSGSAESSAHRGDRKPRSERSQDRSADREAWRERRMESLRAELDLDDEQVERFGEVFRQHGQAARSFWSMTRAEYCGMRERMHEDARALLRPDQLPLFEQRLRRLEKKAAASAPDAQGRAESRQESS